MRATDGADDERLMGQAVVAARTARDRDEVPVGAVVVLDGVVVGRGCNQSIHEVDPTAHAEIVALRAAARTLGNYRLTGAAIYVTVEPCLMCAGAIVLARLPFVYYGATDPKAGAHCSVYQTLENAKNNHVPRVVTGVRADESSRLLTDFFREKRHKNSEADRRRRAEGTNGTHGMNGAAGSGDADVD